MDDDAVVYPPYVRRLIVVNQEGAVIGLSAEVQVRIVVDDLTVYPADTVEVWTTLNEGQRNQFRNLLEHILGLV